MSAVLSCENITVRFGGVAACDAISLDVEQGRIVGLIGPNGAGKTTTIRILLGLLKPTSSRGSSHSRVGA